MGCKLERKGREGEERRGGIFNSVAIVCNSSSSSSLPPSSSSSSSSAAEIKVPIHHAAFLFLDPSLFLILDVAPFGLEDLRGTAGEPRLAQPCG